VNLHQYFAAQRSVVELFNNTVSRHRRCNLKKADMIVVLLSFAAASATVSALAQDGGHEQYVSPWRTAWTYEGAAHWSDLDPEYVACNGKEQSPIDIRNTEKTELPALRFESKSTPLRYVINNRHTIRVNYHPGNGNLLLVRDTRYQLTQFHFHRPSEEYVQGKPYDMEVHLMYQANDGKVAGVTVFVKPGRANSTVQKVWEHMPKAEGQEEVAGVDINPGDLLPNDSASYFMYSGSLTAPPCTEGVTWFVLKTAISLSAEQMDAFAKLYPNDVRPLQPINGRVVKESR
jgi:carbonic anhydrase